MKLLAAFTFYLLLNTSNLIAQKIDYNWMMGYQSDNSFDTICQYGFGITTFNFNQTPKAVTRDSLGISFDYTNVSISDSNGNLLFYTNGIEVRNAHDRQIENADSMGWGTLYTYLSPHLYYTGAPFSQAMVVLPNPKMPGIYDFFYNYIDTAHQGVIVPKVLHAQLDMNANGGEGKMILKDEVLLTGDFDIAITAVKHGNGKDWWLCVNETGSNKHHIMLYTGDNTLIDKTQNLGVNQYENDLHGCRFSTDGSMYAVINGNGAMDVYDFDRCNGSFTMHEQFIVEEVHDSAGWYPTSIEFSPNSRFMYVFASYRVFQYDMWASNIANSKTIIITYHYPGHHPTDYFWAQLAPDGKIYISGGSSGYYISAIDSPDNQGSACHFEDQSIHIPTYIMGLPSFVNYRLGALAGSACDTLTNLGANLETEKKKPLKAFPNPANDRVFIEATNQNTKGTLEFYDINANRIYINQKFDAATVIGTKGWPNGIYFWQLTNGAAKLGNGKVMVIH